MKIKHSILFLALHRPDRSPSQRFRFEQYLQYLSENGFSCKFVYLLNAADDKTFYSAGNYWGKLLILIRSITKLIKELIRPSDITFVQRECFMLGTAFFEKQFSKRSKLVFDLDDSIWINQEVKSGNKSLSFLKNPAKTIDIIKSSDMVFAGNDYLATFCRKYNSNVRIVPTTIDTDEYTPIAKPELNTVTIGWSGSFTTIEHFKEAVPALTEIKRIYGDTVQIKVIGDGSYRNTDLGITGIPWKKEDELKELSQIDIGIMPLPDDEWAKGKCGLKGLQYMALGIATIMSPVGVNTDIIQHGQNGLLAYTEAEWIGALQQLIDSKSSRAQLGEKARNTVLEKYSVKANQKLYFNYLSELIQNNAING